MANYHTGPSDFRIQIRSPNFFSYKSWLGIVEFIARQRTGKALQPVPFRSHAQKILRPLVSCSDFQSPSDPEMGCGTVRRRGKCAAGGTAPNKSWALLRGRRGQLCVPPLDTHPSGHAALARLHSGKGHFFQPAGVKACGFRALIPTPLWLASLGSLAPCCSTPRLTDFQMSSPSLWSLATWQESVTGTDVAPVRQGAGRWVKDRVLGQKVEGL